MTFTCDRCHKDIVDGAEYPPLDGKLGFTAGFYRIAHDGEGWGKYTNPGERVICDACMWSDERYLKDYPHMRGESRPSAANERP